MQREKRKKKKVLLFAIFILQFALPLRAEWFPANGEIFSPLLADPRELQYALRLVAPVAKERVGDVALGDYLGFYRGQINDRTAWQSSGGGGAFGRFDLAGKSDNMISMDWFANIPFDIRQGPWSGRFMIYHTSSHLGDDYLKAHPGTDQKHAWDNLRWLGSYDWSDHLRFYGGYTYVFRTLPGLERNAVQTGFELSSPWYKNNWQYYWANDFQSWQRAKWNPTFTSQIGATVLKSKQLHKGVTFFLEFMAGRQPQGQFFQRQETLWSLGVKLHLS